jgi:hypothetical protein
MFDDSLKEVVEPERVLVNKIKGPSIGSDEIPGSAAGWQ